MSCEGSWRTSLAGDATRYRGVGRDPKVPPSPWISIGRNAAGPRPRNPTACGRPRNRDSPLPAPPRWDRNLLPLDQRRQILELERERPPPRAAGHPWDRVTAALSDYTRARPCRIPRECSENPCLARWRPTNTFWKPWQARQARKESLKRIGLVQSDARHHFSSRAPSSDRMFHEFGFGQDPSRSYANPAAQIRIIRSWPVGLRGNATREKGADGLPTGSPA